MPTTMNRQPWDPAIGQEVEHVLTGAVGKVAARNNAVPDEVRVEWAVDHHASWLPTTVLLPRGGA